jgi:cysteine desulfurase/selenocysteine lyase
MRRLISGLRSLKNVTLVGNRDGSAERHGAVPFNIDGVHPHDAATVLNEYGVAVRAGKHCAHPLLSHLGAEFGACCRASLGVYNTEEDVDRLIEVIPEVRRRLNLGD